MRNSSGYTLTADLLTHPSRYEGFGLQIIEQCTWPAVICTDGGSQPEVAGDAACVVKAGDNQEMASAITEILTSPQRMERNEIRRLVRREKVQLGCLRPQNSGRLPTGIDLTLVFT